MGNGGGGGWGGSQQSTCLDTTHLIEYFSPPIQYGCGCYIGGWVSQWPTHLKRLNNQVQSPARIFGLCSLAKHFNFPHSAFFHPGDGGEEGDNSPMNQPI